MLGLPSSTRLLPSAMSDRDRSRSRERAGGDRADEQQARKPEGGHAEEETGKLFIGNLSYDVSTKGLVRFSFVLCFGFGL